MDSLKVFVASSSEKIDIAKTVASLLVQAGKDTLKWPLDAYPWTEKTFTFSSTYIESLERELDRADFAVVIMTADDVGRVRRKSVNLPRDNVIFELGLFIGRLGRERCFFFVDATSDTRIASDLSGVKEVDFVPHDSMLPEAADRRLTERCRQAAAQMAAHGERYKPSREARARQHEAWRAAKEIAGSWWSLRYWDRDRIGLVELTPDETAPTLHVFGRAFVPDAPNQATSQWESVASTIARDQHKWTLYFVWEGYYPTGPDQKFEGSSRYEFADTPGRPSTGGGRLLEASLKDLRNTQEKAIELRRCSDLEVYIMRAGDNRAKTDLLRRQMGLWRGL